MRQVQDLLGHADPRTTSIYAHVGDRWDNNPEASIEESNSGFKLFRVLSLSPPATSKAVAKLEEELGVKLLHRTTRSVSLTNLLPHFT